MAGPGSASLPNTDIQTKVVGGVTYYSADGGTTWVNSQGEKLSGGSAGGHTLAQPGSKHFGAAPNTIQTNYQIIDLWGFSDQGEGLVDKAGNNIYKFTGDWSQSRYGIAAPLINQGPNKNTAFDANSPDTRFIYYDPNTRLWQRLSPEQMSQLPENILNQNTSRYSGESESPSVGLFYNPETSLFDAEPQTIRAYYGQPEYTAEDVIYRADPASVYDTYDPYAPFETTDPYTNVAELHSARYPYIPPTGPTPSIVRPDPDPGGTGGGTGGGDPGGGNGGGEPPPASEFATERSKNLDFLLSRAQEGVLGEIDPARLAYLRTVDPDKSTLTEEQYNALMAYQASQGQTGGIGVSGIGNTVDVAALNREAGAEALGGYQSSFDAQQVPAASAKQLENMNFLLQQAEAGNLSEEQAAFLNSFDRRRYDDAILSQRDALKAQKLFAEGGGVASLYRDVDSQVTGQGIESFLQRRSDTVNRMLAQRAMAVPRGTMPVQMGHGGDVTITERTVRDPRDNQYVMEERVVRKQMAFDPDMQTGVMSTLYG